MRLSLPLAHVVADSRRGILHGGRSDRQGRPRGCALYETEGGPTLLLSPHCQLLGCLEGHSSLCRSYQRVECWTQSRPCASLRSSVVFERDLEPQGNCTGTGANSAGSLQAPRQRLSDQAGKISDGTCLLGIRTSGKRPAVGGRSLPGGASHSCCKYRVEEFLSACLRDQLGARHGRCCRAKPRS